MRKVSLAMFAAFCLIASGAMAQGLYTNPGFDDAAAAVVDASASDQVNDAAIPGWRAVAVGGARGMFSTVVEATAPSAPNVLELTRSIDPPAGGGFWFDRWGTPVPIDNTKIYRVSAMARQISAAAGQLRFRASAYTAAFDTEGGTGATYLPNDRSDFYVNRTTQNVWEKYEKSFMYPSNAAYGLQMIYPEVTGPTYQVDNVFLQDVTTGDLISNGGFENSSIRPVNFDATLGASVARGLTVSIVNDAAQGNNAMQMQKTNPSAAGDALVRSDNFGFITGHTAYVAFSVKNDPAYGADSNVEFVLQNDAANLLVYRAGGESDGSYKRYEFEVANVDAPAAHLTIDMRLRSNTNDDGTQEAAIVDFISVGDLTVGGVPVEMSSFDVE